MNQMYIKDITKQIKHMSNNTSRFWISTQIVPFILQEFPEGQVDVISNEEDGTSCISMVLDSLSACRLVIAAQKSGRELSVKQNTDIADVTPVRTRKKFEVIQCIPSFTYVTYHVEADDEDQAIGYVESQDPGIKVIGEHTYDSEFPNEFTYEAEEIEY